MSSFVPPIDPSGNVVPHDHPELIGGRHVIRRISEDHVVDDHNLGGKRISSALFKCDPRNGYLSVDSDHCIRQRGRDPAEYVTSPRWFGALTISVNSFRSVDKATKDSERWKIGMAPIPGNSCHAAVWGKITSGQSNLLQRKSDWLVEVPGVNKLMPEPEA